MILLAALSIGVFCMLTTARLLGHPIEVGRWQPAHRPGADARRWLAQAGVPVSPTQFLAASTGVGGLVFVAVYFATDTLLVALVPAVAAALVPRAYFGRQRRARVRSLQTAWPDGLRDIGASVAAGRSLTHALTALAESGPAPLQLAFARFPSLARMLGPVVALEVVKAELADPTSDRVLEVLILAQERGGSVVQQVLDDLVRATTKDLKVLDEIDSEGLEMKINARAVLVLPWLVLVALTIRDGAFRAFYRSAGGVLVVIIGGALSGLGAWWITRLGRGHDERRVFDADHPLEPAR